MTAMDVVAALYHAPDWLGPALFGGGLASLGLLWRVERA